MADHDHDRLVALYEECPVCEDRDGREAVAAADAAIQQAEEHADGAWLVAAQAVVRHLAETRREFTTDDVWRSLASTREPRALGAVMRWAAAAGLVENTHQTVPSTRPECHARPVAVWRSLLPPPT